MKEQTSTGKEDGTRGWVGGGHDEVLRLVGEDRDAVDVERQRLRERGAAMKDLEDRPQLCYIFDYREN
ncbi:hypothetical protein RIF29_39792 [Crotalaria pallida]|uniref:Uncharacterized protein n=1 Tax=Crotalaria pallida TaxID=3830 RepID=A0AAN9E1X3_CROPI